MSALEKKVDALLQFCTAETEEDRGKYHLSLRKLMSADSSYAGTAIDIQAQIDKALADLGIPDHLCGYQYLQAAIEMTLKEPHLIHRMTYEMYPMIAFRYKTNPSLVERGIRHAIQTGWSRCDLEMQEIYFGGKVNPERCKPTNKEFIARICNIINRYCS